MLKKLVSEFVATMILVLIGCGVAIGVGCGDNAGIRRAETVKIPQFALHGSHKGKEYSGIGRQ